MPGAIREKFNGGTKTVFRSIFNSRFSKLKDLRMTTSDYILKKQAFVTGLNGSDWLENVLFLLKLLVFSNAIYLEMSTFQCNSYCVHRLHMALGNYCMLLRSSRENYGMKTLRR
jgi:hypothetical protein